MSDILRRGRLSSTPDEKIHKFTSSMIDDAWIFDADILVDMAHTIMLYEQKIIKREDCVSILRSLLKIRDEGIEKLDWSYEDIHISLESRLIDMVGEDIGGRMHSGRSRNDEVATCIRLVLRNQLLDLMDEINTLRESLLITASENLNTIMPGYTHLQHAQPTTLAHHLLAHTGALERDFGRVLDAFSRINVSPLGAAAFASTGFDINRLRTRELLGFEGIVENSMDAVSTRDFLIEAAFVCTNIMLNLSKMAEEIILWSTSEFNFIELDDQYSSTSSIMPQKKNPDTAELIRGKCGVATGSLMSLITISKSLPLSYNRDLQEATPNIWKCVETTSSSLLMMAGMISTMKINKDAMEFQSINGFTTATELADTLVRVSGIPFRTAHQIVGMIAKDGHDPTLEIIDDAADSVMQNKMSDLGLTEDMVHEALDPHLNIDRRKAVGGPASTEVLRCIDSGRDDLVSDTNTVNQLRDHTQRSIKNLLDLVHELTGNA